MENTSSNSDNIAERIEELEDTVESLEQKTQGSDQLTIEAYDLKISARSEETGMSELLEMCSSEMESLTERALIGEYQSIEREDLFGQLLGDD